MRLTRKIGKTYEQNNVFMDAKKEINKLGQLEDLEEELGIDLITLFKGAFDGIWFRFPSKDVEKKELLFSFIDMGSIDKMEHSFLVLNEDIRCCLSFLDYGKTWALTKEELEHE